ncbi:MAG: SDR family oxidoreductase [Anaerolineales bacterium]|nr:MAG: SDR family oxidoreductase [Anaerolineales bacterium]
MTLSGKYILITGAARRIGRSIALAIARAGGDIIIHHGHSESHAQSLMETITSLGRKGYILQADLGDPKQTTWLIEKASSIGQIFAVINNASIFEPHTWQTADLESWNKHLTINLTSPFLLCQAFANYLPAGEAGRIINILDWRALRPGTDHLPYTISKAALAALTKSLAISLAPNITVNGVAFGAILPPSDGADTSGILQDVPAERWADLEEVSQTILFLLEGPTYITGEIIHLDGGRHLV